MLHFPSRVQVARNCSWGCRSRALLAVLCAPFSLPSVHRMLCILQAVPGVDYLVPGIPYTKSSVLLSRLSPAAEKVQEQTRREAQCKRLHLLGRTRARSPSCLFWSLFVSRALGHIDDTAKVTNPNKALFRSHGTHICTPINASQTLL